MEGILASVDSFLYSPIMIAVQAFSFVVTVGLAILYWRILTETGIVERSLGETRSSWRPEQLAVNDLSAKWQGVAGRMNEQDEAQWKMAIIEADTILDEAIKQMGYKGATMGERMKQIKPSGFPMLDDAWRAHRVRNYIVHDPTYRITPQAAARVYRIYQSIFTRLGIAQPTQE